MKYINESIKQHRLLWKKYAFYKYTLGYSKQNIEDLLSQQDRVDFNFCKKRDKEDTFQTNKFYIFFTNKV